MRHVSVSHSIVGTFISLALAACEKKSDSPPEAERPSAAPPTASAEEPTHARQGVKPDSHEDWCGEHQVPESLCTRCNQSLITAFKATGDWCEEHGLPESQCLICNPDLKIERRPKTAEDTR
jgi:hypothetical protein